MRKIALVILFSLAGLTAIAKQHKSKKKKPAADITSVSSYHTGCFGRCPTFQVEVNKDGTATYTGIRFVHDSGVFTKNIGKTRAARIINGFKAYRADTCKDRYESRVQDLPGINITINYTGKTKSIQNSNLGPIGLMRIGASIDSVIRGNSDKVLELDNSWQKAN